MHDSNSAEGAPLSEDERIAANRTAIFQALRDNGVLRAVTSYTGSGDSGGPDGVRFEMPNEGKLDDIPLVPQQQSRYCADSVWHRRMVLKEMPLDDAISDLAMDLLGQHYGGWEISDGASGEVILIAAGGTVVIEHNACYTDYSEVWL